VVQEDKMKAVVYALIERSTKGISPDVRALLEKALERESDETPKSMLRAMLENEKKAGELQLTNRRNQRERAVSFHLIHLMSKTEHTYYQTDIRHMHRCQCQ